MEDKSNLDAKKEKNIWIVETAHLIKEKIFQLIHITLKQDSTSFLSICILNFISLMQLLSLSFDVMFKSTWQIQTYGGVFDFLDSFFSIFTLVPYIKTHSQYILFSFFYFLVLAEIFLLVLFIFVSSSLEKNKLITLWPIIVLKNLATFINSILLIPALEIYFFIYNCNSIKTLYQLDCFVSSHLAHAIFAGIGLIILMIFSFIVAIFYFDIKSNTLNRRNRQNTNYDVIELIIKILLLSLFEFGRDVIDSKNIFISFVLFVCSFIMFIKIKISNTFFFQETKKAYLVSATVFFWTNSVLFFSKLLNYFNTNGFDANLELWVIGLIFITAYEVFYKREYTELCLIDAQKLLSAEEAILKINFFLDLVDKRETKESFKIILNGYVLQHEEICEIKDCPLKVYKKRLLENPTQLKENEYKLFLAYSKILFEISLVKFPKDVSLRLQYAMFLLERVKNINLSKIELIKAEAYNNSLTQQLIMFRLVKIFDEEFFNFDEDNINIDIASIITFDQLLKNYKDNIEKIGLYYIDFWSTFIQEDINIPKIRSMGYKINDLIKSVFDTWKSMQILNPNDKESLMLHGQFLIEILNEKSNGQSFIEKSKEIVSYVKFFNNDMHSLVTDGSPCIVASHIENKGAIITQLTSSICKIFGYSKLELIGKSVGFLLPSLFRDDHTFAINNFMKDKGNSNTRLSKKISGLGFTKSGFLIPISLNLQFLPSLISQPSLATIVKKEKFTNYTGHLITNKEFDIIYLSSECLKLFQIKEKCLWAIKNYNKIKPEDRINLKHLIYEMTEKNSWTQKKNLDFKSQLNKDIQVSFKKLDSASINNSNQRRNSKVIHDPTKLVQYNKVKEKEYQGLYNNSNKITGFIMAKQPSFGGKVLDSFIMKIEFPVNFQINTDLKFDVSLTNMRSFYFDNSKNNFLVETLDERTRRLNPPTDTPKHHRTRHEKRTIKMKGLEFGTNKDKMLIKDENIFDKENIKNYALDVVLYKIDYISMQIKRTQVIEPRRTNDLVTTAEIETTLPENFKNTDEEEEDNIMEEKSKIEIKKSEILSKKHSSTSKSVIRLQWSSFLILMIHLCIAITTFIYYYHFVQTQSQYVDGIQYLFYDFNYTISSADIMLTMLIIQNPIYLRSKDKYSELRSLNDDLGTNSLVIYSINKNLNSLTTFLANEPGNETVIFKYIETSSKISTIDLQYYDSISELMTTLFSIKTNFSTKMSLTDQSVFYFLYNAMNDYYLKSISSLNYLINKFKNNNVDIFSYVILSIAFAIYISLLIYHYIVLIESLKSMNNILIEFLSISPLEATIIVKKTENFVKNVRINNIEEEDEEKEDELEFKDVSKRSTSALKEKVKKNREGYRFIILILVFVWLILVAYFTVFYMMIRDHQIKLSEFMTVNNCTQRNIISQRMLSSGMKMLLFDKKFDIAGSPIQTNFVNLYKDIITSKQKLDLSFQSNFYYSSSFIDNFNKNIMVAPLNSSKLLSQKIDMSYYYKILPSFATIYTEFFTDIQLVYENYINNGVNNTMNFDILEESNNLIRHVLNPYMLVLSDNIYSEVKNQENFIFSFSLIWFIAFSILIFLGYVFVWRPVEFKFARDYTKTKLLILLIPNNMIMKRNKILELLKKENLVSIKK